MKNFFCLVIHWFFTCFLPKDSELVKGYYIGFATGITNKSEEELETEYKKMNEVRKSLGVPGEDFVEFLRRRIG